MTSVSRMPWQMASSPRLVYSVVTIRFWLKAAMAPRSHSCRVSA